MTHSCMWHAWLICVISIIHIRALYSKCLCDTTKKQHHLYSTTFKKKIGHDSFIRVTWLICMCDMTHDYWWRDSFMCETWLTRMRDMPHSYVWHNSLMRAFWLTLMCDMAHVICVPWPTYMCDMPYAYLWHASLMYWTWLISYTVRTDVDMTHSVHLSEVYKRVRSDEWGIHMSEVYKWVRSEVGYMDPTCLTNMRRVSVAFSATHCVFGSVILCNTPHLVRCHSLQHTASLVWHVGSMSRVWLWLSYVIHVPTSHPPPPQLLVHLDMRGGRGGRGGFTSSKKRQDGRIQMTGSQKCFFVQYYFVLLQLCGACIEMRHDAAWLSHDPRAIELHE